MNESKLFSMKPFLKMKRVECEEIT